MIRHCRGIALLQVLFLSAILTVMLMSIQHMARQHVATAQAVVDKVETQLLLDSTDAQLRFNLLTTNLSNGFFSSHGTAQMNVFDKPFEINSVDIQMQDLTGLISTADYVAMRRLISKFAGSAQRGQHIVAALQDWEDKDDEPQLAGAEQQDYPASVSVRNQSIQLEEELQAVQGMTPEIYRAIEPYITLYPIHNNNVMLMPLPLLELFVEPMIASKIVEIRDSGKLDGAEFDNISGLRDSEQFVNSPGLAQRVTFTINQKGVKLRRQYVIRLTPYRTEPFAYWEYLNNSHVDHF